MEELQPSDVIKKQVFKLYNADPTGWRILVGRDRRGFSDLAIMHPPDAWVLKEQIINPYTSVGYGMKLKADDLGAASSSPYSFGLRPLSERRLKHIAELIERGGSLDEAMERIMRTPPLAYPAALSCSPIMAQGPVMVAQREILSHGQKELDERLRTELQRLLVKNHRQTIIPYV